MLEIRLPAKCHQENSPKILKRDILWVVVLIFMVSLETSNETSNEAYRPFKGMVEGLRF